MAYPEYYRHYNKKCKEGTRPCTLVDWNTRTAATYDISKHHECSIASILYSCTCKSLDICDMMNTFARHHVAMGQHLCPCEEAQICHLGALRQGALQAVDACV